MTRHRHQPPLVVLVIALLAALLPATATATSAATVGGRPAPQVWDVVPAPGGIVDPGSVAVGATAIAPDGVGEVRLFLDGVQVPSEVVDRGDTSARMEARVELEPGRHKLDVVFSPNSSGDVQRTWYVTATDVTTTRLDGADRIATAATIARNDRSAGEAPAAVLARADQFADALAGAPLALAVDGPLLLTDSEGLSSETAAALQELLTADARVTLLGGEVALGPAVEQDVEELGFTVRRVAGASRYDTAARIAELLPPSDEVVVASGTSFPDALAVAAPAATDGTPILLTASDTLAEETAARVEGRSVTIVGGPVAVSEAVEDAISERATSVRRLGGDTRYDTAAQIVRDALHRSPGTDPDTVALASGEAFADALAGAVDAARAGIPLMLTTSHAAATPAVQLVHDVGPTGLRVYGGTVALTDEAVDVLRAAPRSEAPLLRTTSPTAGTEVAVLDTITLTFEDEVDPGPSTLALFFDGREVASATTTGDFADTLVVSVASLPFQPSRGVSYPVRLVGEVLDGDTIRHIDQTFTYRKVALTVGDQGDDVLGLQQRLTSLGYWLGSPDGGYGSVTRQAVMAFQKVEGLPATGVADAVTQQRLAVAQRPAPRSDSGDLLEIDKTRQVIFIVRGGAVVWTINTSTGTEQPYTYEGQQYLADTPVGRFRISRQIDGVREGNLGTLYRPKYFHPDGIAIHGSSSIPNYPASHGCSRMSNAAINFIWNQDLAPLGSTIWVYGRFPGTR